MLSPAEQLLYNSVRITALKGGKPIQFGTGFFWVTRSKAGAAHSLVTNKHVLTGADAIQVQFHIAKSGAPEPSGDTALVTIGLSPSSMMGHHDPDVDLCALTISGLEEYQKNTGKNVFYIPIDSSLVPSQEDRENLDAIEEVVMIGCPNGLFDQTNGLPIVRRGITASHPSFDYNGKKQFVIDAACFPGSSGSPVFLYNTSSYYDKSTKSFNIGSIRVKFLGILFAGPTIDQHGKIVLTVGPKVEISSMMHLGFVLRSDRLLELDDQIRAVIDS